MIKDKDEQPDKEIYRAKSGSLWHKRICPHSIWGARLPYYVFVNLEAPENP